MDMGCGRGLLLHYVARHGKAAKCIGVERDYKCLYSPEVVSLYLHALWSNKTNVELRPMDIKDFVNLEINCLFSNNLNFEPDVNNYIVEFVKQNEGLRNIFVLKNIFARNGRDKLSWFHKKYASFEYQCNVSWTTKTYTLFHYCAK